MEGSRKFTTLSKTKLSQIQQFCQRKASKGCRWNQFHSNGEAETDKGKSFSSDLK